MDGLRRRPLLPRAAVRLRGGVRLRRGDHAGAERGVAPRLRGARRGARHLRGLGGFRVRGAGKKPKEQLHDRDRAHRDHLHHRGLLGGDRAHVQPRLRAPDHEGRRRQPARRQGLGRRPCGGHGRP